MTADLLRRLNALPYSESSIGEAIELIESLTAERDALKAENERLIGILLAQAAKNVKPIVDRELANEAHPAELDCRFHPTGKQATTRRPTRQLTHTANCAVHSPTLRPCSCGLETALRAEIDALNDALDAANAKLRAAEAGARKLRRAMTPERASEAFLKWSETEEDLRPIGTLIADLCAEERRAALTEAAVACVNVRTNYKPTIHPGVAWYDAASECVTALESIRDRGSG